MPYMDEWEYNLWLSLHRKELPELLAVEQTGSEEVGYDGVQQMPSEFPKIGERDD